MSLNATIALYVDFDRDGSFATSGDNLTGYIRDGRAALGISEPDGRIASMGELSVMLNNGDRRFSPNYSGGTYYGKLVPNLPVILVATVSGVGNVTLWTGTTSEWYPHSNRFGDRYTELICHDRMRDLLDNEAVRLPLRTDITADALLRLILAQTYKTAAASGTATFSSNPSASDTLTVDDIEYTFVSALAAAGDVLIGTAKEDTAANLVAAINGDVGAGSTYNGASTKPRVTATLSGAVVTVAADARGAWGNAVTLAESSAGIAVSGATLASGADGPTGATYDFDTGAQTFAYAADEWSESGLNAMTAAQQVVDSEVGFFAFARDGDPMFRNTHYIFEAANDTAVDIDNTQADLSARVSLDNVRNHAIVSFAPRRTLSSGTIARSSTSIEVPGKGSGATHLERWNSYENVASAGEKTVSLPFLDPTTGNAMGAVSVEPLVAGTHYTITDDSEGIGYDYTNSGYLTVTWAVNGNNLELTLSNAAAGSLWMHDLYVEGIGLVAFDVQEIVRQDTTSISTYGQRQVIHDMPLGVTEQHAESYADYLSSVEATPYLKAETIAFDSDLDNAATANLLTLELFDPVDISEYQTGIDALRYIIAGAEYEFDAEDLMSVMFHLKPVSNQTYWILGVTGFSELGTTTRLGL